MEDHDFDWVWFDFALSSLLRFGLIFHWLICSVLNGFWFRFWFRFAFCSARPGRSRAQPSPCSSPPSPLPVCLLLLLLLLIIIFFKILVAFFINASSNIAPIRVFGIFVGLLVSINYIFVITLYPAFVSIWGLYFENKVQRRKRKKRKETSSNWSSPTFLFFFFFSAVIVRLRVLVGVPSTIWQATLRSPTNSRIRKVSI